MSSDFQEIDASSKNEFFEKMFAKRMRRKICPKPGGKDALESQNIQPFRKPDRRFKHRNPFKISIKNLTIAGGFLRFLKGSFDPWFTFILSPNPILLYN